MSKPIEQRILKHAKDYYLVKRIIKQNTKGPNQIIDWNFMIEQISHKTNQYGDHKQTQTYFAPLKSKIDQQLKNPYNNSEQNAFTAKNILTLIDILRYDDCDQSIDISYF